MPGSANGRTIAAGLIIVAIMATGRPVAVGPVQGVALIAGGDPILVILVLVIVTVRPP